LRLSQAPSLTKAAISGDLIGKSLKDGKAMLIDVDVERGYKPM
jgi:hypothetical protein